MKYSKKLALRSKRTYLKEMNNLLSARKFNKAKLRVSYFYLEKFFPELLEVVQEKVAEGYNAKFKMFLKDLEDIRP